MPGRGTLAADAARRLLPVLLACLVAAGAASAAGSNGNYTGAARDIALTAAQAKYKALTARLRRCQADGRQAARVPERLADRVPQGHAGQAGRGATR